MKHKKLNFILAILVFLVIFLTISQIIISNRLALTGEKFALIESEINEMIFENNGLREKIASQSALVTLKTKAEDIGFVKPIRPIYFELQPVVAVDLR